MRVLNTLYITGHRAKVGVRHRAIEIRLDGRLEGRYPMETLDAVVLTGAAQLSTEAIGRCTRSGIRIAALHQGGSLRFTVTGGTSGNVNLRLAQYQTAVHPPAAALLAKQFVAGKLQNQRRLIERWSETAAPETERFLTEQRQLIGARLAALPAASDGDTIRGLEGDATRRYFKALGAHIERVATPHTFLSRTRRPPRDPVNALLSFIYGLLTTTCIGALEAVGLDPQIGFLHNARPGRPSLALDLLEEFRPSIGDRLVVGMLARRQVGLDHFTTTPGGAWFLSEAGRRRILELYEVHRSESITHPLLRQQIPRSLLPSVQATLLARHLRGDLDQYPPFVLNR